MRGSSRPRSGSVSRRGSSAQPSCGRPRSRQNPTERMESTTRISPRSSSCRPCRFSISPGSRCLRCGTCISNPRFSTPSERSPPSGFRSTPRGTTPSSVEPVGHDIFPAHGAALGLGVGYRRCCHASDRDFERQDRLDGASKIELNRSANLSAIDTRAHHGSEGANIEKVTC